MLWFGVDWQRKAGPVRAVTAWLVRVGHVLFRWGVAVMDCSGRPRIGVAVMLRFGEARCVESRCDKAWYGSRVGFR